MHELYTQLLAPNIIRWLRWRFSMCIYNLERSKNSFSNAMSHFGKSNMKYFIDVFTRADLNRWRGELCIVVTHFIRIDLFQTRDRFYQKIYWEKKFISTHSKCLTITIIHISHLKQKSCFNENVWKLRKLTVVFWYNEFIGIRSRAGAAESTPSKDLLSWCLINKSLTWASVLFACLF